MRAAGDCLIPTVRLSGERLCVGGMRLLPVSSPGLSAQRRRPWRCAVAKWLTSPGDTMTDVIDRLIVAVNAHDLDAVAGLFHEDYRSEQPAHPSRAFVGRAQMRANWAAMFAGIPDFRAEICRSVQDGDTVGSEWRWSGTRTDGQTFEVRGVTLFDIADDQIAAGRLYMEDVEHDVGGIEHAVEALSGRRPRRNGQ